MTTIERLAHWAASLRFDEIPARVVEKARWQQASVIAASLSGLHDPGAQKVLEWARAQGKGATRILAGDFRGPRAVAAVANAAVSCTFDYDEILLLGHPGHSTVTLPLALGEELGKSWGEMVAAQIAGNEIAGRLGLASFFGPQNGQMQPFLHCAGAAVAAGKLLGLDGIQLSHALAVALAQAPSALWPAFLGPIEAKVLVAAHATAHGLHAAELAKLNFTGSLDLLDHERGFFHRFSFAPVRRALCGLGRTWLSDTLEVKLHAACWYYQALIDALIPVGKIDPQTVRSIDCRVTFLADGVDASERTRPPAALTANEVNFAIPAAVAVTLLKGRLHPSDLTPQSLSQLEANVRLLASRTRVHHDWALSRRLLGSLDRALDLGALVGDVGVGGLVRALRALRHEFPQAGALELQQLLPSAPSALANLLGGKRREYDLGDHDLSGLLLPIPAAFAISLEDGRVIEGEGDVPAGALTLPSGAARSADKLRDSGGAQWLELLIGWKPDTNLSSALPKLL
jgi:2-methylcitrate dehydratase PrpD